MPGRTIKIHLVEGTPNDVMVAEINVSWTGKVFLAPQTKLAGLVKQPEVQHSGVYILVGEDPDNLGREKVYVGESDNVLDRLHQHVKSGAKEFWNRSIVIVGKDGVLNKALIRYLESRLIEIIRSARRATLDNSTGPLTPRLAPSDIDDMEYFLEQIQMLLPVLGFTFILPIPMSAVQNSPIASLQGVINFGPQPSNSPVLEMVNKSAKATAQEVAGEFFVIRGSTAQRDAAKALSQGYADLRRQLIATNRLIDDGTGLLLFQEDVLFSSTSAAASVVAGSNLNGRITWKVKGEPQTYKDWQERQIGVNGQNAPVAGGTNNT